MFLGKSQVGFSQLHSLLLLLNPTTNREREIIQQRRRRSNGARAGALVNEITLSVQLSAPPAAAASATKFLENAEEGRQNRSPLCIREELSAG